MSKWGPIGFVAGLLAAALFFKALELHRAPALEAAAIKLAGAEKAAALAEEAASVSEGKVATMLAKLDRTASETADLRKELRDLQGRVDAARVATPGGPPPNTQKKRRSFKELAGDLAGLTEKLKGKSWETWPKDAKDLQGEILAAMNELAQKMGLSLEEAMRSPEGLSLLLVDLLAQSVPPLTAAEEAHLRELLAGEEKAWSDWMKTRESLSVLEARRAYLDLAGSTRDKFFAALTPAQRDSVAGYGLFEMQSQGSQTWFDGSRATVTQAIASQWTSTLSLNEQQSGAIAPIVTDYINAARELNDSIWNRRKNGETLSREQDYALRLDLMIETQKRIADTVSLTPDQAQAMKDWQFTYGANVTDEMDK